MRRQAWIARGLLAHREIRRASAGPIHGSRVDWSIARIEHVHMHAGEIARIFPHVRRDFGFRDRSRSSPCRIDTEWPNTVFLWLRAGVVVADQHVAWHDRPYPRRSEPGSREPGSTKCQSPPSLRSRRSIPSRTPADAVQSDP